MGTLMQKSAQMDDSENDVRTDIVSARSVEIIGTEKNGSSGSMTGELERVRDLLFGKQIKTQEAQLANLENQIQSMRRELGNLMDERLSALNQTILSQIESVRRDLVNSLEQQDVKQQTALQTVQSSLTERLDQQEQELMEKSRTSQKYLSGRIDSVVTDLTSQVRKAQEEFSTRLDATHAELSGMVSALQLETRNNDNKFRDELIALGNALGTQKVSRREMTKILVELAQRIQAEETLS